MGGWRFLPRAEAQGLRARRTMSVTEVVMGLGSWSVTLDQAPRELTDRLQFFGHVAIVPGRLEPDQYRDELLTMARYVGVLTRREQDDDRIAIGGQGMVVWLGDADDKGEILEAKVNINNLSFSDSIRAILGDSTAVVEGTLHSVEGTYKGRHQWESKRKAIEYVCEVFGAEYRVNGNGTLDAGTQAQLYKATPECVIVRRGTEGRDLELTGLPGEMQLTRDVEDFTTRVVLLAEGEGKTVATGSANISSNPYLDLRGQPVQRTRLISESGTATGNAQARAQLQLNRFTGTRNALRLSTEDFEIRGSFQVGDCVWVYDPDSGLYNLGNEITFRGQRINPIALRVVEASWPVVEGMTVAYRHQDGTWHDLTPYVAWESGETTIGVGELGRSLTSSGFEPVGPRPVEDTTIPGVVTWVTPFQSAVYVDAEGNTRASMLVEWELPLNEDGSTILDGDHYEIQFGMSPVAEDEWQTEYAPWGALQAVINDLSPGVTYDFRIRAVDTSGNTGEWSEVETATANPDTTPPSTPAAPTVAASALALQIRHELGKASGGTFNLEKDLDHLDIHVGTDENFTPDETTLAGSAAANAGMMQAEIPAVATVEVPDDDPRWVKVIAVDKSGNASDPSAAASATAELLDSAHISELTVTKVSAGTISSNWLIGASIRTASSGQRVEIDATGLHGYNSAGTELVTLSNTGSFTLRSAASGSRVQLTTSGLSIFSSSTEVVSLSSSGSFTLRSAASGSRVELSSSGGLGIFSGSTQIVSLSPSGSFTLRSAASGARIEIDLDGIRGYNSSGNQTFELDADDGSVDIVGRLTSTVSTTAKRLVINPLLGGDPEIRFYEDSTNYHYITSFVTGSNALQIGTVVSSGRKFIQQLEPTNSNFIGLATSSHTAISGMQALSDGRISFLGSGVCSNGGALLFQVQSGPGDGMFRCFWNGSNIQFVRQDTNTIVKTFVIDHPADPGRYLVHATTESPHNGVEYWGVAQLDGHGRAVVELPSYFEALTATEGRAVLLTAEDVAVPVAATYPRDGRFTIRGPAGRRVSWLVKAIRKDVPPLVVEPRRSDVVVRGDGPYRYLVKVV